MVIFSYVVIGGAIAGLIVGLIKYRQGLDWGLKAIIVSLAIGATAGLFTVVRMFSNPGTVVNIRSKSYAEKSVEKLGRYFAEKFAGAKALVIEPLPHPYEPPGAGDEDRIQSLIEGLRKGFGDKIKLVATVRPELPPEVMKAFQPNGQLDSDLLPDLNTWLDAYYFDRMIEREGAGCDLIVSLAGRFPEDYEQMSLYRKDPRPKLALWFPANYRRAYEFHKGVAAGTIDAIVAARPRRSTGSSVPDDLDEAFNRMYLLLTPENIEQIIQQYPLGR